MPRTLIIGYGNPLRGDDGAGWLAATRLAATLHGRDDVQVLAVRQPLPELAEPVSAAGRVIFIDAAVDLAPGQVRIVELAEEPDGGRPTTHHLSPGALVVLARALYGKAGRAWMVAIGAGDFACREGLSPRVQRGVEEALHAVQRILDDQETIEPRMNADERG